MPTEAGIFYQLIRIYSGILKIITSANPFDPSEGSYVGVDKIDSVNDVLTKIPAPVVVVGVILLAEADKSETLDVGIYQFPFILLASGTVSPAKINFPLYDKIASILSPQRSPASLLVK